MLILAKKEIMMPVKQAFNKIKFVEETHTYYVEGRQFKSVSSRIEEVSPTFQKDIISKAVARKRGLPVQTILDEWEGKNKRAIRLGNNAHEFGEAYAFDSKLKPSSTKEIGIVQWWNQLPKYYKKLSIEHPLYFEDTELAGTPDILLEDTRNNTVVIVDYKTNEHLFKVKSRESLSFPFDDMDNTNFNKYSIQLNYYQYMLEQAGYKVSKRVIIWLHLNRNTGQLFEEYDVPFMQKRISQYENYTRNPKIHLPH